MTYTENYHLKKPDGEDFIDIEDLNQNMEAIDAQLKAQAQKAEGDGTKVQEVQAALGQKADLKNGKVPAEQLPEMDYIASADRGAPGGVATLGSDGKVPEGQLPAMNYDPKGTAATAVSNHNSSAGAHADIRQAVANTQAAVQQAASALQSGLSSHTGNKNNPHAVTKEQIGLGQVDNTSDADKPISKAAQKALDQLSDDLEQVAGMTLLGGGAGGGELEDTALEAGSFVNAGAGWNTVRFREAFEGVPHVVCQVENLDCTIQIKDITAEGFLYCLRTLSTGSYYTGASTGTQPSHSATTLVSGTTTTATAVKIHYIAVEYHALADGFLTAAQGTPEEGVLHHLLDAGRITHEVIPGRELVELVHPGQDGIICNVTVQ